MPQPSLFGHDSPSGAVFSPCRRYRYSLWRTWAEGATAVFIGLNPSTADETEDDPTIRRCIGFARDWGHGRLVMLNLFGLRSTDPAAIYQADDPVGPDHNQHFLSHVRSAAIVVAAWGAHGAHFPRAVEVLGMLRAERVTVYCLDCTKSGEPKHPLYIPASAKPAIYQRLA